MLEHGLKLNAIFNLHLQMLINKTDYHVERVIIVTNRMELNWIDYYILFKYARDDTEKSLNSIRLNKVLTLVLYLFQKYKLDGKIRYNPSRDINIRDKISIGSKFYLTGIFLIRYRFLRPFDLCYSVGIICRPSTNVTEIWQIQAFPVAVTFVADLKNQKVTQGSKNSSWKRNSRNFVKNSVNYQRNERHKYERKKPCRPLTTWS